MTLIADFTVEPFVPGAPGPHVAAAIDAARSTGAHLVVGPFGNEVSAELDAVVLDAVARALEAGMAAGASRVAIEVRRA